MPFSWMKIMILGSLVILFGIQVEKNNLRSWFDIEHQNMAASGYLVTLHFFSSFQFIDIFKNSNREKLKRKHLYPDRRVEWAVSLAQTFAGKIHTQDIK